jgi:hypothetical protein
MQAAMTAALVHMFNVEFKSDVTVEERQKLIKISQSRGSADIGDVAAFDVNLRCEQYDTCIMRLDELDENELLDAYFLGADLDKIPGSGALKMARKLGPLGRLVEFMFIPGYCASLNSQACSGSTYTIYNAKPSRNVVDKLLETKNE